MICQSLDVCIFSAPDEWCRCCRCWHVSYQDKTQAGDTLSSNPIWKRLLLHSACGSHQPSWAWDALAVSLCLLYAYQHKFRLHQDPWALEASRSETPRMLVQLSSQWCHHFLIFTVLLQVLTKLELALFCVVGMLVSFISIDGDLDPHINLRLWNNHNRVKTGDCDSSSSSSIWHPLSTYQLSIKTFDRWLSPCSRLRLKCKMLCKWPLLLRKPGSDRKLQ